ncbi:MAG: response regulator [Alphaproteobacteria bacterium]|nr:response regulator [Alphaproteobacteria bacterium]
MAEAPLHFLLFEDNPGDIELTREAFAESGLGGELHVARDGQEGLDFLYKHINKDTQQPCPDAVLLDLNMPRMDGREVLATMQKDARLQNIPVFLLIGTEIEHSLLNSDKRLQGYSTIVKPVEAGKLAAAANIIKNDGHKTTPAGRKGTSATTSGENAPPDNDVAQAFQDFVYHISHDLRAPLRGINFFAKRIGLRIGTSLDDDSRQSLAIVIDNGTRMQDMLDGLLLYSRLCSASLGKPGTTTDTAQVFKACTETLGDKVRAAHARIEIGALPALPMAAEHLARLFLCLLDNAVKFTRPGQEPHITLAASESPEGWHFVMQDNGQGIGVRHKEEIFKIFKRLYREDEYPGVGVGLALARKIVERYGGRIWAESDGSTGSSFHFTIPPRP